MSFGRPPTFSDFKPIPPDRGAFPLDHDRECQPMMKLYLNCLQQNQNQSLQCREISKLYLKCRMDRDLMKKDNLENLGFTEETKPKEKEEEKKNENKNKNKREKEEK